tara:strand:+ start:461 stop:751 length:291 start_codon:yes stop_codon:yes gene_type:complete
MLLHIPVHDLVPELSDSPQLVSMLRQVGIDYATNTIDAVLHDTYMSIFYFADYDMKLQNRWVTYSINWGEAGITLVLTSTRNVTSRITYQEKSSFY